MTFKNKRNTALAHALLHLSVREEAVRQASSFFYLAILAKQCCSLSEGQILKSGQQAAFVSIQSLMLSQVPEVG